MGPKVLGGFLDPLIYATQVCEWIMHSLNFRRLFLDLRKIKTSPLASLFSNELGFRSIGAIRK